MAEARFRSRELAIPIYNVRVIYNPSRDRKRLAMFYRFFKSKMTEVVALSYLRRRVHWVTPRSLPRDSTSSVRRKGKGQRGNTDE